MKAQQQAASTGATTEEVARSLHAAHREAIYSALMTGLTDPFMIPYALALGASSLQAGLLSSARNLLLAAVQLLSSEAVSFFGSRKRLVLVTASLQALLWLPIALLGLLPRDWAVAGLIVLYTVGTASAALGGPAWGSLMAEYLAADERGKYFGHRARASGFWTTVASAIAGGVLQFAPSRVAGFAVLTLGAAASRLASYRWLSQFHETPWHEAPHLRFTFWAFIRQLRRSNFARFSVSLGAYNLATHLASPYFAVYMLEELHFSYASYTAVILAGSVTGFMTSRWWGAVGDEYGNRAVLRWTVIGASVLPVLWLVADHPLWFVLLNVTGAFLWSGLALSSVNFLYDACSPPKRHTCLAYFNVVNGVGISLGAFLGGVIATWVPLIDRSGYATVFCVSALLRAVAGVAFRSFVREVREARHIGLREVVLDFFGQTLEQVLGFFSVKPEVELGGRRRRFGRRRRRKAHPPAA
ncbi:MAG: MFS transporter [Thermodesulfobacteriota bacterium]